MKSEIEISPKIKAVSHNHELVRKRREQIVKAAEEVFNIKGFHRTTVREIARKAKLSTGSIYDYLRKKEDILFLIYEKIMLKMQSTIASEMNKKNGVDEKLKNILTKVLLLANDYQNLILIIFQESRTLKKDQLRSMLIEESKFIKVFEDLVEQCKEQGLIGVGNPKLAGNIVSFLTLLGVLRRWKLRNEFKSNELIEGIIEFVFKGICYRNNL